MSKVIILSNRIPACHTDAAATLTAPATAHPTLAQTGDVWLAWNGQRVADDQACRFKSFPDQGIDYLCCPLTHTQFARYYAGFSHQSLWPALHQRPDLIKYCDEDATAYQQVNAQFAQKIAEIADVDDVIWVHDYHFFSVARYCRELGLRNRIGFFLHTPFADLPMWQSFEPLQYLIEDLCQYDVVGLQTQQDQHHCLNVIGHFLNPLLLDEQRVGYKDRFTLLKSYPVGVNVQKIQQACKHITASSHLVFNFDRLVGQKTIISVDRIDYCKGLAERLNTIQQFLSQYPQYAKQVSFLQIAHPSRLDIALYQELLTQFRQRITQINTQFSQHRWLPIQVSFNAVAHENLIQIFALTDICWITSLADGMNIIAKQYIAAQDPNNPGVLILSKYAGAAEQMHDALIVDPRDPIAMAEALNTALNMSKAERQQRYRALFKVVQGFNMKDWRSAFLQDLKQQAIRKPILLQNLNRS